MATVPCFHLHFVVVVDGDWLVWFGLAFLGFVQ